MPGWIRLTLRIVGGATAGVIALELALRVFVTPGPSPRPDILADSFDSSSVERRQIEEGVATSHFSAAGARLTGNPTLRTMPPALILGDSYVEAEQVSDRQTMGSQLERMARANGVPLDVRQFGWLGASPAQYLLLADRILAKWKPSRVFIALSANDFDQNALVFARPWLRVPPDGVVRVFGEPIAPVTATPPLRASAIAMLARHRWEFVSRSLSFQLPWMARAAEAAPVSTSPAADSPPDSAEYARAPHAVVRALRDAYGSSLTLIYIAELEPGGDEAAPAVEPRFMRACIDAHVVCLSTRTAMEAAYKAGHFSHGTGIAPPGNGHLNPGGHAIVARLMWQDFSTPRPADSGQRP